MKWANFLNFYQKNPLQFPTKHKMTLTDSLNSLYNLSRWENSNSQYSLLFYITSSQPEYVHILDYFVLCCYLHHAHMLLIMAVFVNLLLQITEISIFSSRFFQYYFNIAQVEITILQYQINKYNFSNIFQWIWNSTKSEM